MAWRNENLMLQWLIAIGEAANRKRAAKWQIMAYRRRSEESHRENGVAVEAAYVNQRGQLKS
jgi:hypothetical protein